MKRHFIVSAAGLVILSLTGCSLSLLGTPTPFPTIVLASPTPLAATETPLPTATVPTATMSLPTVTPGVPILPTVTPGTGGNLSPGSPSGPYAVIQVAPGDVLNVRAAPGAGSAIVGSFGATATDVMRTGPSSVVGSDLWVEVQNPSGGTGWVNAFYLTEYVAPATFCADGRVNTLLSNFGAALVTSNGEALAALVSPAHGMTVRLWRNGNAVTFDQEHAQWVFTSTYEHNWGAAPGSGLDTIGAFHVSVLPKLLDVFNAPAPGYTLSCNQVQTGGASYDTSWPATYANVNFYSIYKPGPAGNENSWRTLLVGIEYVQGQPYIFSVTQMDWEP